MHRWSILGLLTMMSLPCWASKHVNVVQLEQALSTMTREHRSDVEMAIQIGTLEPSQRISNLTLVRLTRLYAHGPQSSIALQLIADRSSFLQLPAKELPPTPTPDEATQQKLLESARKSVLNTLPRLPNLLATRTTYSFDDSPRQVKKNAWPEKVGLHLVDITKAEVSVRNEKDEIAAGTLTGSNQPRGFMTSGEFGSALLMVFNDSEKGTTTWSHWEQFPAGLVAVFNYSVPKSASHYEIASPADRITHIDGSDRWVGATVRATGRNILSGSGSANRFVHTKPEYHGSLWIDPATGTVLRITIIAKIQESSSLDRAATLVDYGPINIGDKSYVCPVRSFALSDAPATASTTMNGATTEWLNENLFANYHLFAATSRIVGSATGAGEASTSPKSTNPDSSATSGSTPETPAVSSLRTIQTIETTPLTSSPKPPPANSSPVGASIQVNPVESIGQHARIEMAPHPPAESRSVETGSLPAPNTPTATVPAVSIDSMETARSKTTTTLRLNVNAVLVPVVVRDDHGQSINDLKKQDFSVFDNGRPRPFSGFLVENHAVPRKPVQGTAESETAARMTALPGRFTVFVFDDMHLTADQIAYAQKAAIENLGEALTGSDLAAVVTISGKINSGLIRDRKILTDAIMQVRPEFLYRPDDVECPRLNVYQADLIVNMHDPSATDNAIRQVLTVCEAVHDPRTSADMIASGSEIAGSSSVDPLADAARISVESAARLVLQRARQDLLNTYATISELVKKMAVLPGQRTIILVSSGFPPVGAEESDAESSLIDLATQSGVTINALNASGVYNAGLQADNDVAKSSNPVLKSEYRERVMQNEENSIWDLADGTGGEFFHNDNDLAAGFRRLLNAPETVYLLEIPLNGIKANGGWHRLSVKTDRVGAQIQARRGYFAPSKGAKRKPSANGEF